MIRRPPRSTPLYSSAASDVYKRQTLEPQCALSPQPPKYGSSECGNGHPLEKLRPASCASGDETPCSAQSDPYRAGKACGYCRPAPPPLFLGIQQTSAPTAKGLPPSALQTERLSRRPLSSPAYSNQVRSLRGPASFLKHE